MRPKWPKDDPRRSRALLFGAGCGSVVLIAYAVLIVSQIFTDAMVVIQVVFASALATAVIWISPL